MIATCIKCNIQDTQQKNFSCTCRYSASYLGVGTQVQLLGSIICFANRYDIFCMATQCSKTEQNDVMTTA